MSLGFQYARLIGCELCHAKVMDPNPVPTSSRCQSLCPYITEAEFIMQFDLNSGKTKVSNGRKMSQRAVITDI